MDEITDQNQPVSYPLPLTCASCIRAGQRAAARQAAHAKPELVTHRMPGTASRDPVRAGVARSSRHCSPARPGALLAMRLAGVS
jgi:hypothetical protein